MKKSKGISLIALIITIIVIIILAAIVLSSGGDTTNKAQLAVFTNNFSQYADQVTIEGLNVKQTLGVRQENVNDAQLNYMIANGLKNSSDFEVKNRTLPVGYSLPDTIKEIYMIPTDDNSVVAYVINDGFISGYNSRSNKEDASAGYEFYGDTNGLEYHFITSNGHVFTIPGFAVTQDDGTIQFYISNEKGAYYVVRGQSSLAVGDYNKNGDKVNELAPIIADNFLAKQLHGLDSSNHGINYYGQMGTASQELKDRHTMINGESSPNVYFDRD